MKKLVLAITAGVLLSLPAACMCHRGGPGGSGGPGGAGCQKHQQCDCKCRQQQDCPKTDCPSKPDCPQHRQQETAPPAK